MEIFIDDREPAALVPLLREKLPTARIASARLRVGDFEITHEIVIERKTVADFETSLVDGRLFRQAAAMSKQVLRPLLFLEGDPIAFHHVSPEAFQGAMISLIVQWNIPILFTRDLADTAHAIVTLSQQRTRSSEGLHHRGGYQPKRLARRQIYFLQGLPGIGAKRAVALLQHFGSPLNFLTASDEAVLSIKGLGAKFVEKTESDFENLRI